MLNFDPETHIYTVNREPIPGVSEVLAGVGLVDVSKVPPGLLARASEFGTNVHTATELDDYNELDEETVDDAIMPYLEGWRKFKQEHQPEMIAIEYCNYSPTLLYGFIIDRVCVIGGEVWIIDIKTSSALKRTYAIQTGSYQQGWNHNNQFQATRRGVVHLKGGGEYRLKEYDDSKDVEVFNAALTVYKWSKYGSRRPRKVNSKKDR